MDIDIVIPKTGDQPYPDIEMVSLGVQVELRGITGGLRVPAKARHGIQSFELRELEQCILKYTLSNQI